jgi:hypothetical protein
MIPMKMTYKHIQQPCQHEGCGIAVMARLLQKTYEETLHIAMEKGFCDKYKRVNLAQMKRFLLYIGLENVSFIKHDGVSEPKNNGIFHGRWDNVTSGARHWIACYEGLYFDPLLPHPVPHLPEGFHVTQIFNHP